MPTRLPNSVQEAWGEQATEDFSQWIEEYVQERTAHREVVPRLDVIGEQLNREDAHFAPLTKRLNRMEERFINRFDRIDQRLDAQRAQFDERVNRLQEQKTLRTIRWVVGTTALFGTIITILAAIAEFGG